MGPVGLLQQTYSISLDGGRYLIYAPLKKIAFLGNASLVNAIVERCQSPKTSSAELDFLENLNFFQPEPFPEDESQHREARYDATILFLTNQCNLRCTYCYASSGENPKKMMIWEIAKAGIDRVMQDVMAHQSPSMTLGFHGGGEPTLNWEVLTKSVEYACALADRHCIRLNVSGAFNGYWQPDVTEYITRNLTDISLSFDGLPVVQNTQRPAAGNAESFTKVADTLRALDQAQFPYAIRMTVTNETVSYLADSVALICEQFHPRKIQVEPVFEEGRARKNRLTMTDLNTFMSQFIRAYAITEGHQIPLLYSGGRLEVLNDRFCLAACRALIVTPDGDVTTCFEIYDREHPLSQHFVVGKYQGNGGFLIDQEKLSRHLNRTIRALPYCDGCFCKWHCAGDCAAKTLSIETINGFQPSERCLVNREVTKFLLLHKIKTGGGVFWANQE